MCLFCDKKPEVPMHRYSYDLGRDFESELDIRGKMCPVALSRFAIVGSGDNLIKFYVGKTDRKYN